MREIILNSLVYNLAAAFLITTFSVLLQLPFYLVVLAGLVGGLLISEYYTIPAIREFYNQKDQ